MTILCRVLDQQHVLERLREIDGEMAERAQRRGVFCIARTADREALRQLYEWVRLQRRGRGPWIEDHSPLRHIATGHGLKLACRDARYYLSLLGGAGPGGGSTAAHEWLQGELCAIGEQLHQTRSEAEFVVPGGRVDVVWDVWGWEVDLTVLVDADQRQRARVRQAAGLSMISLVDASELGDAGIAEVPRVGVQDLADGANACASGQPGTLARGTVENIMRFEAKSRKWRRDSNVCVGDLCEALLAGELVYRAIPGTQGSYRWLRHADLQRAQDLEEEAAQRRASEEAAERALAAAQAEVARLRSSLAALARKDQEAHERAAMHRATACQYDTEHARVVALTYRAESLLRGYLESGASTPETAPLAKLLARIVNQPWWLKLWAQLWAWMSGTPPHTEWIRMKKRVLEALATRARAERQQAEELEKHASATRAAAQRLSERLGAVVQVAERPKPKPEWPRNASSSR